MNSKDTILRLARHETVVNSALKLGLPYAQTLEQMVIALVRIKNHHQNEVMRYIQKYGSLEVEE
jgi:hypothetical protein